MSDPKRSEKKEKFTLRRLAFANLIAVLAMLLVAVLLLWQTGLLASILTFLF